MARLRFQVWLDIREMQAEDLARIVGVSNQAVHRWLKHGIPRARVANVANALSIEPSELYRFVDTDIASELVDYSQESNNQKRRFLRRTKVDTTAANSSGGAYVDEARAPLPSSADSHGNNSRNDASSVVFADRRKLVDRRRHQSRSTSTPSRRATLDRRDTRYRNAQSELWWLKVDYLDGQFEEGVMPGSYETTEHNNFEEITLDDVTLDLETQLTGTDSD
ncbi:MAG: helix-turn-helix domain-containing protein [Pseudomonadales bacterium]